MTEPMTFTFSNGERLPVEVLVFEVAPEHVEEFLTIDHDVWTLGEAFMYADADGDAHRIPFRSKEVWLDDANPGQVWLVFVWESLDAWQRIGAAANMARLQHEFDQHFVHPVTLVRAFHDESNFGIHRVSRFERVDADSDA